MALTTYLRKLPRKMPLRISWGVLMLLLIYVYLGFHALTGSQGLVSWANYKADIPMLSIKLTETIEQREDLERYVKRLKDNHISQDSLGQISRKTLNVSHANEYVIWLDETP